MRAHFNQIKIMALCLSLLAALAPTLVGCGTMVCTTNMAAPPPAAALTVDNGVVYSVAHSMVSSVNGKFVAMRESDGTVLWQNAENPYFGPHGLSADVRPTGTAVAPVVDGQTVIETMGIGLFVALRVTDGRMLWHSQMLTGLATSVHGALAAPPVVADGVIYAAVGYGAIAAWDERDGSLLWVSHFAPDVDNAWPTSLTYYLGPPLPVVAGSAIYASVGRSVYALRVSDGSVLWRLPDAPVDTSYSTPVVAANTVYVADSNGLAIAIDAKTGAIRWRSQGRTPVVNLDSPSSVVVSGRTVYVASQGSLAQALDATTGAQLWRYETPIGSAFAPLAVAGGHVYLTSLSWSVYVLDAATGRELWRAMADSSIFNNVYNLAPLRPNLSTSALDQGAMVLAAANGAEAWNPSNGQELWVTLVPNKEDSALVESAAVASGMVYLAQGGIVDTCGDGGRLPRVLALRGTDGAKRWQVSI